MGGRTISASILGRYDFHLFFAYTAWMKVIGYEKRPDWPKLGPSMLIAATLVVGIRTARWAATCPEQLLADVDPELDKEVLFGVRVARRVVNVILQKDPDLLPERKVPTYEPEVESPE